MNVLLAMPREATYRLMQGEYHEEKQAETTRLLLMTIRGVYTPFFALSLYV